MRKLIILGLTLCLLSPTITYAEPGNESTHIDNWQTFRPSVTALRSLNAYLATDENQQVYYVPTLEELPNIKNSVSDCVDYKGKEQRFAAVYDGYFDQMCHEALVRKSDGSYSRVPAIVQTQGASSVRELTKLGYDFLLSSEYLSQIDTKGESVTAIYNASKVDSKNGYVDLNTALMDIYKAIGQDKFDIQYIFTPDSGMTVENSPIQQEINITLSNTDTLDTSRGKGWVFATRTNPSLYWKQAVYDGVIWDSEALHESTNTYGSSNAKTDKVSLADFCMYAYNIMNIYGEPVITQSEKNILLQLYGSVVPYKACSNEAQIDAIETLIAKGIISPDDDAEKLNWNAPVDFQYMLTLLMRINDINSRKTYKDIQITMDVSMINNDYYNAKLAYDTSNVTGFKEAVSAAKVTNYYDAKLSTSQFEDMAKSLTSSGVSLDLFIPTHLVFTGPDGSVFPLTTQVTTYSKKVYSQNSNAPYVLKDIDASVDGSLMQFCISDGIQQDTDGSKFLHLRIASFNVKDLLHSDDTYHLHLIDDKGNLSDSAFIIKPGGGIYYESGIRSPEDGGALTDRDNETAELSNLSEIDELIDIYDSRGESAAKDRLHILEKNNPQWTLDEIQAAEYAASNGDYLSVNDTAIMYMSIVANSEPNITVKTLSGETVKLSDIMSSQPINGVYYADPDNQKDLSFIKVNDTTYMVDNCSGVSELNERIKSSSVNGSETAYCRRDEDLLVSTSWLKNRGIISTTPVESGDILMLSTQYANIYLDRKNQYIVVGASVYDVKNKDPDEIWMKSGSDIFVNFRAVLGWTGDFMIFKNTGGTISVSVTDTSTFNPSNPGGGSLNSIKIKMLDIPRNAFDVSAVSGNTVTVQGFSDGSRGKTPKIPMVGMYPFANYFVYINTHVLNKSEEFHDWLFVFKRRDINVNGKKLDYDDSVSRKCLEDAMDIDSSGLDKNITVWAYPLYRSNTRNKGMPSEMSYSDKYGYRFQPKSSSSGEDVLANYFNTDNVMSSSGNPEYVLPFYIDSEKSIRCFNYNTYTVGGEMLKFGELPISGVISDPNNVRDLAYSMLGNKGVPNLKPFEMGDKDYVVGPAVTSPALWFLELQKYNYETVRSTLNNGSALYWGTSKVELKKDKNGSERLYVGVQDKTEDLKKMEFLLMRETALSTDTIGRWYSVSALTSFDLKPVVEGGTGTEAMAGPSSGLSDKTVSVIDWKEYSANRLLENTEFGLALAMIIVLNFLPRIALGLFVLLITLGVIQDAKIWRRFCERVFDPYKFLTFGRRDVTTFNAGKTFIASIVAMAVLSLFMDGTILHVYEWIMNFIGVFLS